MTCLAWTIVEGGATEMHTTSAASLSTLSSFSPGRHCRGNAGGGKMALLEKLGEHQAGNLITVCPQRHAEDIAHGGDPGRRPGFRAGILLFRFIFVRDGNARAEVVDHIAQFLQNDGVLLPFQAVGRDVVLQ